jgi:hypothetical protein
MINLKYLFEQNAIDKNAIDLESKIKHFKLEKIDWHSIPNKFKDILKK